MVINDLPPEILEKFLYLLTYNRPVVRRIYEPGCAIRNRNNRAPFAFAHVCRYWRAVAFSIKNMWASFCGEEFKPEALAHCASLSRPVPLHLTLYPRLSLNWREGIDDRTLKKSKEKLDQFAVFADRWGSLYFDFRYCELIQALTDMLQTTAPRSTLQRFEICMLPENPPLVLIDKLVSAIASFPSLRHFCWIFRSIQGYLPRGFPWRALEVVYVEASVEVEDLIWLLMECTSATTVTLIGWGSNTTRPSTVTLKHAHSTLPRLKSLTIYEISEPYWFLQHFTLPSLVSLEIELRDSLPALQEFFIRSQCPLLTFTVECPHTQTADEVIECLSTPYLRSVPDVAAIRFVDSKRYLAEIIQARPDILHDLPGITAWYDRPFYMIGWKKSNRVM